MSEPLVLRDDYMESVVDAKRVRSVVKTEFAQQMSTISPSVRIFAVEGPGDRCVYFHWTRSVAPQLEYEFFQCGNKDKVLQLFDSLERDRTGLGALVYFFVDRDFDDLQGRQQHQRIFSTAKYAIENYLVTPEVLEDVLSLEFHCHGAPSVRNRIIELFNRVFDEHLKATNELNYRAFVASALNFRRIKSYPDRINQIAKVELDKVSVADIDPAAAIVWQRDLTADEEHEMRERFSQLEPRERYRGKFALCFFIKWLDLLRCARLSDQSELFASAPAPENRVPGNFSLETLAPKARAPICFREFMAAI